MHHHQLQVKHYHTNKSSKSKTKYKAAKVTNQTPHNKMHTVIILPLLNRQIMYKESTVTYKVIEMIEVAVVVLM